MKKTIPILFIFFISFMGLALGDNATESCWTTAPDGGNWQQIHYNTVTYDIGIDIAHLFNGAEIISNIAIEMYTIGTPDPTKVVYCQLVNSAQRDVVLANASRLISTLGSTRGAVEYNFSYNYMPLNGTYISILCDTNAPTDTANHVATASGLTNKCANLHYTVSQAQAYTTSWGAGSGTQDMRWTVWTASDTPLFVSPTPLPSAHNNTQITINFTCVSGSNLKLWFDQNANPSTLVRSSNLSYLNYTTSVITEGAYYFKGACDGGLLNSTPQIWYYDAQSPSITINPNNGFNYQNLSTVNPYLNTLPINLTVTDNIQLFAFEINITKDGTTYYNLTNLSLSGTSYNFYRSLNVSKWTPGEYKINLLASDSHTLASINDYVVTKKPSELEFKTEENNNIRIVSDLPATTEAIKTKDRYSFNFDFDKSLELAKVFHIYSDNPIKYIADSQYKAHFVIYKNGAGNWVDFEGIEGTPTIKKITDLHYTVTFQTLSSKITFNSIGGLNVKSYNYSWVRENASAYTPTGLSGLFFGVSLIATKGEHISAISTNLYYDGVEKTGVTSQDMGTYIVFNATLQAPNTTSIINKSISWNITATQTDALTFQTYINNTQTIYPWGIDNCSLYTIPVMNFSVIDEKLLIPVNSNVSFYFQDYYNSPEIKQQYNVIMNGASNFQFCKSINRSFTGELTFVMRADGFGSRSYRRDSQLLDGKLIGYLLAQDSTTANIPFKIVKGDLSPVTATMSIYRTIGGNPTLIYYDYTDFAGQLNPFLDQTYTYDFVINATNYPLKSFSLLPVDSVLGYTIKITEGGTPFYNNEYSGIKFRITPKTTLFNISDEYQKITFEVVGNDLEEFGINISDHSYACLPVSCVNTSTTITGGAVSVNIKINETGTLNTAFYFTRLGGSRVYVNDGLFKAVMFLNVSNSSLTRLASELRADFSPSDLTFLVGTVNMLAVGIGSFLGLYGVLLMIPVMIIDIILALPDIGLLNPLVAIFLVIFGAGMILLFGLREGG